MTVLCPGPVAPHPGTPSSLPGQLPLTVLVTWPSGGLWEDVKPHPGDSEVQGCRDRVCSAGVRGRLLVGQRSCTAKTHVYQSQASTGPGAQDTNRAHFPGSRFLHPFLWREGCDFRLTQGCHQPLGGTAFQPCAGTCLQVLLPELLRV